MTTEIITQTYNKVPRAELVAAMRKRDGDKCMHPDCRSLIDFSAPELIDGKSNPLAPTIDHWMPQAFGKANDWTMEEIWALSNLKMMHKKCNAKKGDLIPNEDGTLPKKAASTFRFRRQKRAGRPELCGECDNGHALNMGEVCANCGCNAQRFPRSNHAPFSECDHELFWCIWCSIGDIPRVSSVGIAMRQADSSELGEILAEG